MLTTYQGDWMQLNSEWAPSRILPETLQFYPYNLSIIGIPFGEHTLNFTTHAQGDFILGKLLVAFIAWKKRSLSILCLANPNY